MTLQALPCWTDGKRRMRQTLLKVPGELVERQVSPLRLSSGEAIARASDEINIDQRVGRTGRFGHSIAAHSHSGSHI